MTLSRYCKLGDFTLINAGEDWGATEIRVDDGGGEYSKYSYGDRQYSTIINTGRKPRRFRISAAFKLQADLEAFLEAFNEAAPGDLFYPFSSDRHCIVSQAWATVGDPIRSGDGWHWMAQAEVIAGDPGFYGAAKGIAYATSVSMPAISAELTHAGTVQTEALGYLLASGSYDSGNYTEGLGVRITPTADGGETDRQISLCTKMMQNDSFELFRDGRVEHSYNTDFPGTYAAFSQEIMGLTSGGVITGNRLEMLDQNDYFMIPFYGPLPISEAPRLDLDVYSLASAPDVCIAFQTNLSDIAAIDHEAVRVGQNTFYFPDCIGEDFVAIGVKCLGASDDITLNEITGTVKRYVAPSSIPKVDPDEVFKIRVEETGSCNYLAALQVDFNDKYWY